MIGEPPLLPLWAVSRALKKHVIAVHQPVETTSTCPLREGEKEIDWNNELRPYFQKGHLVHWRACVREGQKEIGGGAALQVFDRPLSNVHSLRYSIKEMTLFLKELVIPQGACCCWVACKCDGRQPSATPHLPLKKEEVVWVEDGRRPDTITRSSLSLATVEKRGRVDIRWGNQQLTNDDQSPILISTNDHGNSNC